MGKISKKYIGTDQVGSVQIELENALSLRAKSQDGLSSVDLLEYSASDALVVQQDLHVLANKSIISDSALGAAFIIGTSLGADMVLEPGTVTGSDNAGSVYIRGGDSATGVAGAIYLEAGIDSSNVKGIAFVDAGTLFLQNSTFFQMQATTGESLQIYESFDYADSYGIKANNDNLVMYTNSQSAASTNSKEVSLITGNSTTSGNTGDINIISGNATSGDSGSINLTSGTASGTRGSVVLDAAYVNNNVIGGNAVSMNFVSGNSSSLNFSDALLSEANRSLGISFVNAGSVNAFAITGISLADNAVGPVQLIGAKLYKTGGGAATSGAVSLSSSADLGLVFGADAEISSGDISIVTGNAQIKGTGANASSGDILIETGTKEGTGTRGSITLDALEVQCSAMQFKDAADPTSAQDLATKAYVDAQIDSGTDFHKEIITLNGTNITNQYVDLQFECIPQSVMIGVGQRVNLYEGSDFSVSVDGGTGGVARVSFTGPSADGGAEELVDGDILYISFVKA